MTLNELCDDILLNIRNNQIAESEKISKRQIELWINTYRAMLIKQDIDKGRTINPMYTQHIIMNLIKLNTNNHIEYRSKDKLPTLIDFNYRKGVVSVKDMFGNIIQLGNETKMKYQKYRKFTCKDYIAYTKGDYLYVEGLPNLIECVEVEVIAENPTDLILCYDPDKDEYPIPAAMWSTIKQLIFEKELNIMLSTVSDTTNDSKDDTQNVRKNE